MIPPGTSAGPLFTPSRVASAHGQASDLGLYGAAPAAFASLAPTLHPLTASALAPAQLPPGTGVPAAAVSTPLGLSIPAPSESAERIADAPGGGGSPGFSSSPLALLAPYQAAAHPAAPAAETSFHPAPPAPVPLADFALLQQHSEGLKQAIADLGLAAAVQGSAAEKVAPIVAVQQQAAEVIGAMTQLIQGTFTPAAPAEVAQVLVPAGVDASAALSLLAAEQTARSLSADAQHAAVAVVVTAPQTVTASADSLLDTAHGVQGSVVGPGDSVIAQFAPVEAKAADALDHAAQATGAALADAAASVAAIETHAHEAVGAVQETVGKLPVDAAEVAGKVADLAAPVVAGAQAQVAAAVDAVHDTASQVGDTLATTTAAATASLSEAAAMVQQAVAEVPGNVAAIATTAADTLHAVTEQVPTHVAEIAGTATDTVKSVAEQVPGHVADIASTATEAVHAVAEQAPAPIAEVAASATDTVTTVAEQAPAHLANVASAATDTLQSVTEHTSTPVAEVASGATETITAATTQAPTALAATATDTLHDLAGSDPAGGLQTLTGLVSAADVFQLHDEVSHDVELADGLGALGTLDLLAPADDHGGLLGAADVLHHQDHSGLHDLDLGHG